MPVRFGKHPAKSDYRTLRLRNYLMAALPAPPPSYDVLPGIYAKLGISDPGALFPMDGNDTIGDCTIAGLAHAITVYNGLIGKRVVPQKNSVSKLYFHLSGGQDTGLNELDVLRYWQSHSALGEKILAYVSIDLKNRDHIKQAIRLFGGIYIGFQVQANCVQEFDARTPWTPGPLTNDGHAVLAVQYDQNGITVLTWGNTQKATWAWWDECVDEAYAILPPQAKATDFAPGLNFNQLMQDLQDVAN